MHTRTIILWSATLLATFVVALLVTGLAAKEIEESWNIVVVSQLFQSLRLTFLVALAHAVVFGLPLFLFLRSKSCVGIIACAVGGFIVGAAGPTVLGLLSMFGNSSYNAWSGGRATIVNGVPTLTGWLEYAQSVGFIGLIGLCGGLTFWLTMRLSGQIPPEAKVAETPARVSRAVSWTIVATAISLTCAALLLPSIAQDSSCHNLFRDGRASIEPRIHADLNLTPEDWAAVTKIFTDFGAAHSLSLRSDQQIRRGQLLWRSLDLCDEAGTHIEVMDQPWLDRMNHAPVRIKGIKLRVHEFKAGSDWNPLAHELVDTINNRWPEKFLFHGRDGKPISEIEAFADRQ
jgi:hypothetical protein